jgi:hypothetical protein
MNAVDPKIRAQNGSQKQKWRFLRKVYHDCDDFLTIYENNRFE